jgi:hypothetical protein
MIAALIENGIVANLIVVQSLDVLPGLIDGTGASIGDGWDGTQFVKPMPVASPIPQSVTRRQAKQALILANLIDRIQPALDAITDPTQRALMQSEWDDSQDFFRGRPAVTLIGNAIGLDAAGIDNLFIRAAAL